MRLSAGSKPALQQALLGQLGHQRAHVVRLHQQGFGRPAHRRSVVGLDVTEQGDLRLGRLGVLDVRTDLPLHGPGQRGQARHELGGYVVDVLDEPGGAGHDTILGIQT